MKRSKARCITTAEGRYINVDDIKAALQDDEFVKECAAMLVIARDRGDWAVVGLRQTIGCAIAILVGDVL